MNKFNEFSLAVRKSYYQALSGAKILSDEDWSSIDSMIKKIELDGIQKDELTDIYLLWTLSTATLSGEVLLKDRISKLSSILLNSEYSNLLEYPIKRLKTHGTAIDKYVFKSAELGLNYKKVAVNIGAWHYILNSNEFSDEEITNIFQFQIDWSKNKWLRLDSLKLKEIPVGILKVKGIKKLDLNRNPISQLPADLFNFTDLKKMGLENTKIIELPDEIGNLSNLEYLNLSNSKLKKVSSKIEKLSNLRDMRLNESKLEDLPNEISNLKNLDFLNLRLTPLWMNKTRIEELKKLGCPI
jgi:hypothetical protein